MDLWISEGLFTNRSKTHEKITGFLAPDTAFMQVELKSGVMYRGELTEAEDNWNIQLKNVDATSKVWCATSFPQKNMFL